MVGPRPALSAGEIATIASNVGVPIDIPPGANPIETMESEVFLEVNLPTVAVLRHVKVSYHSICEIQHDLPKPQLLFNPPPNNSHDGFVHPSRTDMPVDGPEIPHPMEKKIVHGIASANANPVLSVLGFTPLDDTHHVT